MDYRDDSVSFLCGLATGLALGVLGMFMFDPKEGRLRRAVARDKIVNRAQGMAAETKPLA